MARGRKTKVTPEEREKLNKTSHTPEALAKAKQTRQTNILIKSQIYASLRDLLLKPQGKTKTPLYQEFLNDYVALARKEPEGKAGQTLASVILTPDILTLLDEEQEKRLARDLDFMRYRILKECFYNQLVFLLDHGYGTKHGHKKYALCASRRAGKTESAARALCLQCTVPDSPCLYVNLTFANAIDQEYDLILSVAESCGLCITRESKTEGLIEFNNGSSIKIRGNKDNAEADKMRGFKYKLVIIDEAGHQRNMKYLVNEVLEPLLNDYEDSILVLQGTPPRVPHTFFENAYNSKEYTPIHWEISQNPHIPDAKNIIAKTCEEKGISEDDPLIQREYYGRMGVYDVEAMVFKDRKTYKQIPADWKPNYIIIGIDFGFADYNSVVTLEYNTATHKAYVTEEHKWNKSTVTTIISVVKDHVENAKARAVKYGIDPSTVVCYADTNEKSIIYDLTYNYGVTAFCCYKYDRIPAIAQLADELRTGRMQLPAEGITDSEMESIIYRRDEGDNILPEIDEQMGTHPEITMALLYSSRQMFSDFGYSVGGESGDKKERAQ